MKKIIKRTIVFFYKAGLELFGGMGLQKVWPLGAIRDWLSHIARTYDKPEFVMFKGLKIYLDKHDNIGLGIYGDSRSASEISLMDKLIKKGDTIIDVGANIGFFTLIYARLVGPTGRVFAFEPDPENAELLRKNIEANGFSNVVIEQKAVGEKDGTVILYLSDFNVGDHRIYDPEEKTKNWERNGAVYDKLVGDHRQKTSVGMVSLDSYFAEYDAPISFVKIDVQGAEGGVFVGMKNIIERNPDIKIFTEFWPAGMAMYGMTAAECLEHIKEMGFHIQVADEQGGLMRGARDASSVLSEYTVENNKTANLLLVRQ